MSKNIYLIVFLIILYLLLYKSCRKIEELKKQNETQLAELTSSVSYTKDKENQYLLTISNQKSVIGNLRLQAKLDSTTIKQMDNLIYKYKNKINFTGGTVVKIDSQIKTKINGKIDSTRYDNRSLSIHDRNADSSFSRWDSCLPTYYYSDRQNWGISGIFKATSSALTCDSAVITVNFNVILGREKSGLIKYKDFARIETDNPNLVIKNFQTYQVRKDYKTKNSFLIGTLVGLGAGFFILHSIK
jgi:hypothetical protein